MRNAFPLIAAAAALAVAALGGCPKNMPGAGSVPSGVPSGGGVPGGLGGMSGEVDPNTCGNYALMDGGAKLKAFLQATKDLQTTSEETIKVVKQSCEMIGREMAMTDADFQGDTKAVCDKVYKTLRDNMKVAFKAQAGLKIKYKPAVCRVNVDAEAKAAAECEGHASADVGASCTGACHGRCDGTCSGKAGTGGNSAQCDGECKGTCHGECEGHAKVNASAQCRASASVKANAEVHCTEPELTVEAVAKAELDKSKAEMVIRALKNGLPKALSIQAHLEPLKDAVAIWVQSAQELKDMGPKFVNSFKDQAMCISGQLAAAVNMIGKINANVSVSVDVSIQASATASGSAGA
jgi:hypothetical protein